MTVDWSVVAWIAGMVVAWSTFLIGMVRWFLQRMVRDLDAQLVQIRTAQQTDTGEWRRVERELMELRADLPTNYVRREDHIRNQSVIEAKLDALATKLEIVRIEGAKHER